MYLLPILLLVCIILEKSDNGIKFGELYTFKSKENTLTFNSNPLNANAIHECMYDNQEVSLFSAELNVLQKVQADTKKKINLYVLGFNNKKFRYVKFGQIIPQRNDKGCYHSPFYCKTLTNRRRKLLSYLNKVLYENPTMSVELHEKEQTNLLKDIGHPTENNSELWDEWSNWSICSVTCGSGRQVRWRHCSAEHCIKGLKRAQIKACRLKNCDSKDILHWLGIKSK